MESAPGPETVIDGRKYLYFGGTGYLGLAGHPAVVEAACAATRRYGVHTATSRHGFGTSPLLLEVERLAAQFFGAEAAFYFVSGYVANHLLVQALAGRFSVIFLDEAAHYCLAEAAALGGCLIHQFRHRDAKDLRRKLREPAKAGATPLVMTDGVFPSTGQIAPLGDYLEVLRAHGAGNLLIDDAHGFGVLGENGRGSLEHLGLWGERINQPPVPDRIGIYVSGTLSKALGGFGGILAGAAGFIQQTRAASHYYDGASAPPSAAAAASAKALEIVLREPALRQQLRANIRRVRAGLRALGVAVDDTPTANVGVAIGDAANMRRIHQGLKRAGILVPYVGSYSGIGRHGLLRIAVCAGHTEAMINRMLEEIRRLI